MLTVIWVLGSMLVMLLIHFLLPLGYTKKGKFVIVVSSGLLALGGLAATAAFPVWQTLLMLLVFPFLQPILWIARLRKSYLYRRKSSIIEEDEY